MYIYRNGSWISISVLNSLLLYRSGSLNRVVTLIENFDHFYIDILEQQSRVRYLSIQHQRLRYGHSHVLQNLCEGSQQVTSQDQYTQYRPSKPVPNLCHRMPCSWLQWHSHSSSLGMQHLLPASPICHRKLFPTVHHGRPPLDLSTYESHSSVELVYCLLGWKENIRV